MPVTVPEMQSAFGGVFATKPVEEIEEALSFAEEACPEVRWGRRQALGVKLYAAHVLATNWYEIGAIASMAVPLAGGNGGARPLGNGGDPDSHMQTTTYGQRWIQLRRQVINIPGRVIGANWF